MGSRNKAPNPAGEHIRTAVRAAGGLLRAAKALGRTHNAIGFWYFEPQRMDALLTRQLCRMSGYSVPVSLMRPDIFGGLSEMELGYKPAKAPADLEREA